MRVFTESDVQGGNNNFPFAGPNTIEAKEWHAHPLFTEAQFFVHDVGVVVLSKAFSSPPRSSASCRQSTSFRPSVPAPRRPSPRWATA